MNSKEHIFAARTGKDASEFFPEEIQEALRAPCSTFQDGRASQQTEYDMTRGWVLNIRLISEDEKPRC